MTHNRGLRQKPADLGYLCEELRRLSSGPRPEGKAAFWRILRLHLSGRQVVRR